MRLPRPKSKYRTTLAQLEQLPDITGIYIFAYMGKILYVGQSASVPDRIRGHYTNAGDELIGAWLRCFENDWGNVRLDLLEAPILHSDQWMDAAEIALIKRFNPLFNQQLQSETKRPVSVPALQLNLFPV